MSQQAQQVDQAVSTADRRSYIEGLDEIVATVESHKFPRPTPESGVVEVEPLAMDDIFTDRFMASNTPYESWTEFASKMPWDPETREGFCEAPMDTFDVVANAMGYEDTMALLRAASRSLVDETLRHHDIR